MLPYDRISRQVSLSLLWSVLGSALGPEEAVELTATSPSTPCVVQILLEMVVTGMLSECSNELRMLLCPTGQVLIGSNSNSRPAVACTRPASTNCPGLPIGRPA